MADFYLIPKQDNEPRIKACEEAIRALDKDKRWHIKIGPHKDIRTTQQNKYLWGVAYSTIAREMIEQGEEHMPEVWHEYFKQRYITPEVSGVMGSEVGLYRSTAKLSKKDFGDYLEHLFRFAGECGFQIPQPEFEWKGI